jgi:hypothetical protein
VNDNHRVDLLIHPRGKEARCPCGWRVRSRSRRGALPDWMLSAIMKHGRDHAPGDPS